MNHASVTAALVFLAAAPVSPPSIAAQGASLGAVTIWSGHTLVGEPLAGGALQARFRVDPALAAFVGVERAVGRSRRVGVACSGLAPPGACAPEPLLDEVSLTSIAAGLELRALSLRRLSVHLAAGLRLGRVFAETRGSTSGAVLPADKRLWGGDVGASIAWSPSSRLPVTLDAGVEIGGLTRVVSGSEADGYEPFDEPLDLRRLRVGLTWRR